MDWGGVAIWNDEYGMCDCSIWFLSSLAARESLFDKDISLLELVPVDPSGGAQPSLASLPASLAAPASQPPAAASASLPPPLLSALPAGHRLWGSPVEGGRGLDDGGQGGGHGADGQGHVGDGVVVALGDGRCGGLWWGRGWRSGASGRLRGHVLRLGLGKLLHCYIRQNEY